MLTVKTKLVHSVLFSVLLLALACGQRPNTEEQIAQSPDSVHPPPIEVARSGSGVRAKPQASNQTRSADRPKLIAHLKDGSQIVGIPRCDVVSVRTAHGSLDLPFADLLSIDFKPGSDSLVISFQNGDRLHGVLASDICEIVAIIGNVSLVPKNLLSIVVDMPSTGILEDALLGYYPFNGDANDKSGHGKNGTVHGAVLTSDRFGRRNSAYRFDGEDSYISFARGWIPPDIEGFSASLWLYAEERTKGLALYTGAILGESSIGIDDDGLFFAANFVPNSSSWIKAGVPAVTGRFVHIVGVYRRGQTIQLWINGELKQETSIPIVDLNHGYTTHNASIGSYSPNHFNHYRGIWLGVIDDVRLYGRALSAREIRHLYQTER
jgi:hypothetical protein